MSAFEGAAFEGGAFTQKGRVVDIVCSDRSLLALI